MGPSGGSQRKGISAIGDRAHRIARALSDLAGHTFADAGGDIVFADIERADDIARNRTEAPLIAVSGRRLRAIEVETLLGAGASAVIDADANVLDAAFAASDLLFPTCAQRRRYGRVHGGVLASIALAQGTRACRLLDLGRSGAFVVVDEPIAEGTPVRLEVSVLGQTIALRGRVAFSSASADAGQEIAIEFALDDHEVAPKIVDLIEERGVGLESNRPRRRASRAS